MMRSLRPLGGARLNSNFNVCKTLFEYRGPTGAYSSNVSSSSTTTPRQTRVTPFNASRAWDTHMIDLICGRLRRSSSTVGIWLVRRSRAWFVPCRISGMEISIEVRDEPPMLFYRCSEDLIGRVRGLVPIRGKESCPVALLTFN